MLYDSICIAFSRWQLERWRQISGCQGWREESFPGALMLKNPPSSAGDIGDAGLTPRLGRSLEKEMATHSSILAWRIPWIGAWWITAHEVSNCQTQLKWLSTREETKAVATKQGEEFLRGDKRDLYVACNSSYSDLHVLVHLGCSNKTPLTEWLIKGKHLFFIILEAKSSKIKAPAGLVAGNDLRASQVAQW